MGNRLQWATIDWQSNRLIEFETKDKLIEQKNKIK